MKIYKKKSIENMQREKSLGKNAVFNIGYRILNVIFPLVSTAYIARILEPDGVGKVAYAQNIVSYFVLLAALGIPKYGTREIAKCRNDQAKLNKLFSELFWVNAICTVIACTAFGVMLLTGILENPLVYLICGLEIVFNIINIDWFYEGEEEYVYITLRSVAMKCASLVALFIFVKESHDYTIYALIHCLGICGNYLFNIVHVSKKVKLLMHGLELKKHIKPIVVLALSSITAGLYGKLNVTILGWLQTDEIVGFYTNAHKIVMVGITLVTAMSAVFMPRLSYIFSNDKKRFEELISMGTKIILLLAIPCCMGVVLLAEELVLLAFGPLFEPATLTLRILSITIVVMGVGDLLCYQMIISSGNEKLLIKSRVVAGCISLFLNFLLIPKFQHNGAAAVMVISEVIVNGMLLKKALEIVKPRIGLRFIISLLLSTIAMTIPVILTKWLVYGNIQVIIVSVSTGAMVYFVTAILQKNEIIQYFFNELKKHRKA